MVTEIRNKVTQRRAVAVIVHYGQSGRTVQAALRHIESGAFSDVIVVANDGTTRPEGLDQNSCKWLIPNTNLGFGGACQFGAMSTEADIYAFFNAHTSMTKDAIRQCLTVFESSERVGIVAPQVLRPNSDQKRGAPGHISHKRIHSRILGRPIEVPTPVFGAPEHSSKPLVIESEWATGAAIFCRGKVIREIGWDGSYFLTFEDPDISTRARLGGWSIALVTSAVAFHSGESTRTSSLSAYYCMRNAVWYSRRFKSRQIAILVTLRMAILLLRVASADALKHRIPSHFISASKGLRDGWILLPITMDPLPGEPLIKTR
jgi:N-acetylglucosaminyl-diphospho-decaprenol L-rhamnosyltransferase